VKVYLFRWNPKVKEKPRYELYDIDIATLLGRKEATLLELLGLIARYHDHSLAFLRHSNCNRGVCKRCMVRLNGKVVLACNEVVSEGMEVKVEPVNEKRVVRDLVTEGL